MKNIFRPHSKTLLTNIFMSNDYKYFSKFFNYYFCNIDNNDYVETIVSLSVNHSCSNITRFLLFQFGEKINLNRESYNTTPIIISAFKNDLKSARLFLAREDVNINYLRTDGKTALDIFVMLHFNINAIDAFLGRDDLVFYGHPNGYSKYYLNELLQSYIRGTHKDTNTIRKFIRHKNFSYLKEKKIPLIFILCILFINFAKSKVKKLFRLFTKKEENKNTHLYTPIEKFILCLAYIVIVFIASITINIILRQFIGK